MDEVLPALTVRPGAAAHTAAKRGARRHNPDSTQFGWIGPVLASGEIQVGMQLTFRSQVTALAPRSSSGALTAAFAVSGAA